MAAQRELEKWYEEVGKRMFVDRQENGKGDARENIVRKKKAKKEFELEEPDVSVNEPERRQSMEPEVKKRKVEYRKRERKEKEPESETSSSESSSSESEEEVVETELRGVIGEGQRYEIYLDGRVFYNFVTYIEKRGRHMA